MFWRDSSTTSSAWLRTYGVVKKRQVFLMSFLDGPKSVVDDVCLLLRRAPLASQGDKAARGCASRRRKTTNL